MNAAFVGCQMTQAPERLAERNPESPLSTLVSVDRAIVAASLLAKATALRLLGRRGNTGGNGGTVAGVAIGHVTRSVIVIGAAAGAGHELGAQGVEAWIRVLVNDAWSQTAHRAAADDLAIAQKRGLTASQLHVTGVALRILMLLGLLLGLGRLRMVVSSLLMISVQHSTTTRLANTHTQ